MLETKETISEGQAGLRPNHGSVHTLGEIIQGRKDCGPTMCGFFLYVQGASGAVWRDGLRKGMQETGIRENKWRIEENIPEVREVHGATIDGELSKDVDASGGGTQGCTLSPTLFAVFINGLSNSNRSSKVKCQSGDVVNSRRIEEANGEVQQNTLGNGEWQRT